MDASKVMDDVTKERYLRQLNYKNRMKLKEIEEKKKAFQEAFQEEEKRAFLMIPKRPDPNIQNAFQVIPNRPYESPGNESLNSNEKKSSKNNMEMAVSAKGISINILQSNNIYDGDRGKNKEKNVLQNNPLNHTSKLNEKYEEQNPFKMWRLKRKAAPNIYDNLEETDKVVAGDQAERIETSIVGLRKSTKIKQENGNLSSVSKSISFAPHISTGVVQTGMNIDVSICDRPELPETSKVEVINSQLKSKLKLFGVCMAVMMVMMAVMGFCVIVYYFTPRYTDNSSENITAAKDVPVTSNVVPVTTGDVPVTTKNPQISESIEKSHVDETTETPQIKESSKHAHIGKSTEEIWISEKSKVTSKPLKQKISLDWSDSLKSYSYNNMRKLIYKVRHKISLANKNQRYSNTFLVVVRNQLWFIYYGKINVYSRKGELMKSLEVDKNLALYSGIETGSGDVCFASDMGVVAFDTNGKQRYTIYKKRIYMKRIVDLAYDKGILYALLNMERSKVLRFVYIMHNPDNDNNWVEIGQLDFPQQKYDIPFYSQIEVRKNTMYALRTNKKLCFFNMMSNIDLNNNSSNIPKVIEVNEMRLISVDYNGVSLLSDMKQGVLKLCSLYGNWSKVTPLQDAPIESAVVDPNDNGIWVVTQNIKYNSWLAFSYNIYKMTSEE